MTIDYRPLASFPPLRYLLPILIASVKGTIPMLKLAVFTVMLPDLTPEDAVHELKASGYDGVEWRVTTTPEARRQEAPSFWGNNLCTFAPRLDDARRARAVAASAGLAIPGLGTYLEVGDLAATEAAMHFAQECGAPQIRVSAGRWQSGASYHDLYARARAYLASVEPLAQRYGVKALIEIHHRTIVSSASLAFRLVEDFNPAHIGVIHDAGNMIHEGYEEYAIGIELLGPYLAHVHVKNGAYRRPEGGGVWRSDWSPLEDGLVDFDALFRALRAAGYQGWVAIEDFSAVRPTREALRFNIDFLRAVIQRTYGG